MTDGFDFDIEASFAAAGKAAPPENGASIALEHHADEFETHVVRTSLLTGEIRRGFKSDQIEIHVEEGRVIITTDHGGGKPRGVMTIPFNADEIDWLNAQVMFDHTSYAVILPHTELSMDNQRLAHTRNNDGWRPGELEPWEPGSDDDHEGDVLVPC